MNVNVNELPNGLTPLVEHLLGELANVGLTAVLLIKLPGGRWKFSSNQPDINKMRDLLGEGSEKVLTAIANDEIYHRVKTVVTN